MVRLPPPRITILRILAYNKVKLLKDKYMNTCQCVSSCHNGLDSLYRRALEEGGNLIVYAGGDTPTQQDYIRQAFEAQFPGIVANIIVDLSKYHSPRIDNQLARGALLADVAHLQTSQDFDRWKNEGRLLCYKPLGWEMVYPEYKDPAGYYTALNIIAFSNIVNNLMVSENQVPRDAVDYLAPQLKGQLVFTYPNDDDAVLFQFKMLVDNCGWDYIDRLITQRPQWVRGTEAAYQMVVDQQKAATFTAAAPLVSPPTSPVRFLLPEHDCFLSWPQRAAIFKAARHPAAAMLYLSWWLSLPVQENIWGQWPVRRDARPPGGYQSIFRYNTDPLAFVRFMRDRAAAERFRGQIEQYVGPVVGPSPTQFNSCR